MGKEAEMIEQQMVSSDRLLVSPPLTRLSPSTLVVTNLLSSQPLLRWRRQPRPRTTVLSGQTITGQSGFSISLFPKEVKCCFYESFCCV